MKPYAARYGGHQFGQWAGQLGDGRAITLAEVVNRSEGLRPSDSPAHSLAGAPRSPLRSCGSLRSLAFSGQRWELQLKGAGKTPYSRGADGRAVLRSSLREFLCSEAMHHLGVPTTRALSLVATGDQVLRDMLYDGHPRYEPGAVVCRVAPSFTRFGNFELPASRGELALLRRLLEFTLKTDRPDLVSGPLPFEEQVARWFSDLCERTAALVVHWMRVGFVHGV